MFGKGKDGQVSSSALHAVLSESVGTASSFSDVTFTAAGWRQPICRCAASAWGRAACHPSPTLGRRSDTAAFLICSSRQHGKLDGKLLGHMRAGGASPAIHNLLLNMCLICLQENVKKAQQLVQVEAAKVQEELAV